MRVSGSRPPGLGPVWPRGSLRHGGSAPAARPETWAAWVREAPPQAPCTRRAELCGARATFLHWGCSSRRGPWAASGVRGARNQCRAWFRTWDFPRRRSKISGSVSSVALSWIPDPLELDTWMTVEHSPQLWPSGGLSVQTQDPDRCTSGSRGVVIGLGEQPSRSGLTLCNLGCFWQVKNIFDLCLSAQFGHHSRDRQPFSSGPALPLFLPSFLLFYGGVCIIGCPWEKREGFKRRYARSPLIAGSSSVALPLQGWDGRIPSPASGLEVFGGPGRQQQVRTASEE